LNSIGPEKIIDCIGTIKDGGNIDHDYAGSGLARLYATARRKFTARQTSATILQFPNGERLAKRIDPGSAWPSSALLAEREQIVNASFHVGPNE
jgi:hypothetical protein